MIKKTIAPQKKISKKRRFKFKVSIFYLALIVAMALLNQGYEIVIYTAAVVMHELAHAQIAERKGFALNTFKLMPYGASLTGEFEGASVRDEVLIALAGPAFNLCLTVPSVALWWIFPSSYYVTKTFVTANIFIAVFNLLPVFPLDGGRILLSLMSIKKSRQKAYKTVRILSLCFSIALALIFVLSYFYGINFSFITVAVFIFVSSIIPDKNSYYQRLYSMAFRSEKLKRGLPVKEIMVDSGISIFKLTKMLNSNYYTKFTALDFDMKPLCTITETDLEKLTLNCSLSDTIKSLKSKIL